MADPSPKAPFRSDKLLIFRSPSIRQVAEFAHGDVTSPTRNRPADLLRFYWCQRRSAYLAITYGQTLVISRGWKGDYELPGVFAPDCPSGLSVAVFFDASCARPIPPERDEFHEFPGENRRRRPDARRFAIEQSAPRRRRPPRGGLSFE